MTHLVDVNAEFLGPREWRTHDVVAIAKKIRLERDVHALPILADAMQDGGFPEDDPILTHMRKPETEADPESCLFYAVFVEADEDVLAATAWIENFVKVFHGGECGPDDVTESLTWTRIIVEADKHAFKSKGQHVETMLYHVNTGFSFSPASDEDEKEFWVKYRVVRGEVEMDEDDEEFFFECGC